MNHSTTDNGSSRIRSMPDESRRHRFSTTRWTLVVAAGGSSPAAADALAALCETYWYPVYAWTRRSGHSADQAADLTQAFFVQILEKGFLKAADRDRGKFRSYLLGSLRHFLANEWDWRHAQKREGGHVHISIEFEEGERRYAHEPVDTLTPDRVYEHRWATAVLDEAMAALSLRYEQSGRQELFKRLRPHLTGDPSAYSEMAAASATTEGALRAAVHRLRKDFAASLRAVVAETVERHEDVEDELRFLLKTVEDLRRRENRR